MTVRYRDGIEIHLSDGTRVVCDADEPPSGSSANRTPSGDADEPPSDSSSGDGDVAVVSHAHGDHLPEGEATAVCSPLTADLASARREVPLHATTDERIELLPAGHVAGSTAALVTDPDGTRYLYTGDVCTRSRFYLDGFEPVDADVLITETTYGEPEYVFPDHGTVASDIVSWLRETDEPVLLFGYALGRAQKLQLFAREAGRERLFTTDAVLRVNDVVESHLDVSFDADRYGAETELGPGDALVLPMTTARIDWIRRLAEETGAVKAGFSGWAVDDAFTFRGDFDVTFPLSDHCDFAELRDLVDAVDPDRVYTQHGSTDAFAETLTRRGYEATALKRNQTALGDF